MASRTRPALLAIAALGLVVLAGVFAGMMAWQRVERTRFHPITMNAPALAWSPSAACIADRDTRVTGVAPLGGDDVLVQLEIGAVDLWSLAVFFWPEVLTGVVVIVSIVMAARMWRRRPTTIDPHCRRCDYRLFGGSGERCPECGLELTPRRRVTTRRSTAARAGWLVAPLVVVGLYVPVASFAPRRGGPERWISWPSTAVYDWGYRRGFKFRFDQHKVFVHRIVTLDMSRGEVAETITLTSGEQRPWSTLVPSPDGTLVAYVERTTISVIDARARRQRLRVRPPPGEKGPLDFYNAVSFDASSRRLYGARWSGIVDVWNVNDGRHERSFDLFERIDAGAEGAWHRGIAIGPDDAIVAIGRRNQGLTETLIVRLTPDLREQIGARAIVRGDAFRTTRIGQSARWLALVLRSPMRLELVAGEAGEADVTAIDLPIAGAGGTLAVAPDATTVLATTFDAAIDGSLRCTSELLTLPTWRKRARLGRANMGVLHAAFAADGKRLFTGGVVDMAWHRSAMVAVWDVGAIADADAGADTNADADPDTDADTDTDTDTDADTDVDADADTDADTDTDTDADTDADPDPDADSDAKVAPPPSPPETPPARSPADR